LEKSTYEDYDWMMGVNFGGVVNGIQTFVPCMISYGKGGHIVNTAFLGAFVSNDPAGIYCASKFAVRGLSEALHGALAKYNIGVSCLCPMNVNTNIAEATFTRPRALANSGYEFDDEILTSLRTIYSAGMDPVELAQHVVTAIRKNQLYVIPYPEARTQLRASFEAVLAALPPEDSDPEGVAKREAAMARSSRNERSARNAHERQKKRINKRRENSLRPKLVQALSWNLSGPAECRGAAFGIGLACMEMSFQHTRSPA
jgi:short chain dehydrogenase